MKIIPLNYPNCGKRLEIGENKEQLACGTCGSQLYVDRSGGTISLELAKSLGAISTGAAQTAAELALVRLEKELSSALNEIGRLEYEINRGTSELTTYSFNEQDIMSEQAVASAYERMKTLEFDIKGNWGENITRLVAISLIIVSIITALYFAQGKGSFVAMLLIIFGVIDFILMMIFVGIFTVTIDGPRTDRLKHSLEAVKNQITRHQGSIEFRKKCKEANSTIFQANEKLPNVRATVAQIEAEISHNKKIVSLKH